MKGPLIAGISVVSLACVSATAQPAKVDHVRILERGVYDAHTDDRRGLIDGRRVVHNPRLIRSTINIEMRKGTRFGFRYVLQGAPQGHRFTMDLVTRYPSPGMFDQKANVWRRETRYKLEVHVGVPRYREFQLVEKEEFIAGPWVFEFWLDGRKLGEQQFCLSDAEEASRRAEAPQCQATISQSRGRRSR